MVIFSGDLDKAIAGFIIANGAASMGHKVTMFFTFWGLNILRKDKRTQGQEEPDRENVRFYDAARRQQADAFQDAYGRYGYRHDQGHNEEKERQFLAGADPERAGKRCAHPSLPDVHGT